MNVKYMFSLMAVVFLFLFSYLGTEVVGLKVLFGIIIPYIAIMIFVAGFISRVMGWAASAVPFCIPTTCGQQSSLPWIKQNRIDNPSTKTGVIIRMLLEILCFRSLFRNTKMKIHQGQKISYKLEIWLWVSALAFHWTFLVVLIRHLRFFTEPIPGFVKFLEFMDSLFKIEFVDSFIQIGLPGIFMSGFILLAAVSFLLVRRIIEPRVKYISLAADFFPLFLIIGIAVSGIYMRYVSKVDIIGIKELTMGLATLHPTIPEGISSVFFVHLFFVSSLLIYFPFSKLMHMAGIFLSPTRNMLANTRAFRHVNPWNYPVKTHTYEEYEDEFREKMIDAGLPVDKKE